MAILIIKSNALTTEDVLIRDMGIIIPFGGGQEIFTDNHNISDSIQSLDLRDLTTDDNFGTDGSTLILNDGVEDIDASDVDQFLNSTLSLSIGNIGELGDVNTAGTFAPEVGDLLMWSGTTWIPNPIAINDLTDVDTTGLLAIGDTLVWDGINWVPTDPQAIFAGTETFIAGAQDTIITTSLTYELAPDMTITPGAGTYIALFSASASMNKNARQVFGAIHYDSPTGVLIDATSVRELGGQANNIGNIKCIGRITVGDGESIHIRWLISDNTGGGQGTMIERSLILLKTFSQ